MNVLDSSWYWWANRLSSYLLLSVLWLLCSAPIFTLFPATVALFTVFRAWQTNPDEAFYQPFFAHLRQHFWGDFGLGLLWLLSIALLALNLYLLPAAIPSNLLRALAFGTWLLGALVLAAGSIFIFPLRAGYDLGIWPSVRTAVALGLAQPITTLLCLGVLTLTGLLFLYLPASLLLSSAGTGHLISWLCTRTLRKLEAKSNSELNEPT